MNRLQIHNSTFLLKQTDTDKTNTYWGKTSKVPPSAEWNSLLCKLFFTPRCAAQPPQTPRRNKTKIESTQTSCSLLPVSTPLTLQLCLQKDPLQLPLQGGGDAVLRPCQTLPAAHGCDQLLQLDPGAWWGNNTGSRVCNDARAVSKEAGNRRDSHTHTHIRL